MRRLCLSLGSLSLIVQGAAFCETQIDEVTMTSATQLETFSSPSLALEQEEELDDDDLASVETDPSLLDAQLASLEQELSEDETPQKEEPLSATASEETSLVAIPEAEEQVDAPAMVVIEEAAEQDAPLQIAETPVSESSVEVEALASTEEKGVEPAQETHMQELGLITDTNDTNTPSPSDESAPSEPTAAAVDTASTLEQETVAYNPPENVEKKSLPPLVPSQIEINLKQVFAGAPLIYSLLLILSIFSFAVWLYNIVSLQAFAKVPDSFLRNVRGKLLSCQYEEALSLCEERNNFFCKMIASGIQTRKHGIQAVLESMKSEGKRASISFWQRLGWLQDIAIMAPMLGLLGTVMGMFYAFYDLNRSIESISSLFDGLGVSVGTTVAGIIVAIVAMVLHSIGKFRLVKTLCFIENEAVSMAQMIDKS